MSAFGLLPSLSRCGHPWWMPPTQNSFTKRAVILINRSAATPSVIGFELGLQKVGWFIQIMMKLVNLSVAGDSRNLKEAIRTLRGPVTLLPYIHETQHKTFQACFDDDKMGARNSLLLQVERKMRVAQKNRNRTASRPILEAHSCLSHSTFKSIGDLLSKKNHSHANFLH